jgi:PadR family transcriptional regulator AphA
MKVGVLGHLLLGLLSDGERTGYELTRDFDTSLANVWGASHSQIYPELAKLESEGLIRKTEAGPRGSQRYTVTGSGRAEAERWLSDTTPADAPRSERMARVFFLGMLPKERAASYLAEQQRAHREKLERFMGYAALYPPGAEATQFDRIALEAGIRVEKAMAEWAAWAIAAIGEESQS